MSSLEKLGRKYEQDKLKILLINMREDREVVADFMKERGYTNTVLLDAEGEVARKYRAIGIPISIIIDKNGGIADAVVGYVDWGSATTESVISGLSEER